MLYFTTSNSRIDTSNTTCIDTDTCLLATYLPIAISDVKIDGNVSSLSTNTHEAYCLSGVQTPAITGVGILIRCLLIAR